jgi:hypothetical protein
VELALEPVPSPANTLEDPPSNTSPSSPPTDDEGETTPKASEVEASVAPIADTPTQPSTQPKANHVLIVDDNDINLKVSCHDPLTQKISTAVTNT